jgi:hypothetical protein
MEAQHARCGTVRQLQPGSASILISLRILSFLFFVLDPRSPSEHQPENEERERERFLIKRSESNTRPGLNEPGCDEIPAAADITPVAPRDTARTLPAHFSVVSYVCV